MNRLLSLTICILMSAAGMAGNHGSLPSNNSVSVNTQNTRNSVADNIQHTYNSVTDTIQDTNNSVAYNILDANKSATDKRDIIMGHRPIYGTTGLPIDGTKVDANSCNIKIQAGFALMLARNIGGKEGLDLKFGYTHRSVWNFYAYSSPFKGHIFIPGLYLDIPLRKNHFLEVGIEHRSNGVDDEFSRSINNLCVDYSYSFPFGLTLDANAWLGFSYVEEKIGLDVYNQWLGYFSLGAMYEIGRFGFLAHIAPAYQPFFVNTTAEISFRLCKAESCPYHLFLEYHHGYDECMHDCVMDTKPKHFLRFGILIMPRGARRLLF